MDDVNVTPTTDLYGRLQWLTEYFNRALFSDGLPPTMITLQRSVHTAGHFSESRWRHISGVSLSELALNPTYFAHRPLIALCQTVVHELCHLWQKLDGSASRPGYHNSAWADKMEEIGLMPSSTGRPGGAKVGQKMADYPIEDGAFLRACEGLVTSNFALNWVDNGGVVSEAYRSISNDGFDAFDRVSKPLLIPLGNLFPDISSSIDQRPTVDKRKTTYQCPNCFAKVWGKRGLSITCGECGMHFREIKIKS